MEVLELVVQNILCGLEDFLIQLIDAAGASRHAKYLKRPQPLDPPTNLLHQHALSPHFTTAGELWGYFAFLFHFVDAFGGCLVERLGGIWYNARKWEIVTWERA